MEMLESMEDSGFDSDPKPLSSGLDETPAKIDISSSKQEPASYRQLRKSSDLQRKIERQREATRKAHQEPKDNQTKGKGLLSRTRLVVPTRHEASIMSPDQQPLVMLETDDSDEEFAVNGLSLSAHKAITQQLIKDGYNLDLEPDDEDLDLIPPRPLNERSCYCCQVATAVCCIQ